MVQLFGVAAVAAPDSDDDQGPAACQDRSKEVFFTMESFRGRRKSLSTAITSISGGVVSFPPSGDPLAGGF